MMLSESKESLKTINAESETVDNAEQEHQCKEKRKKWLLKWTDQRSIQRLSNHTIKLVRRTLQKLEAKPGSRIKRETSTCIGSSKMEGSNVA